MKILLSPKGTFPAKIIDIINPYQLVMNRGEQNNIQVGRRVLVYEPTTEEMSNQLKETIADYGIENSLDAMINLIESGSLNELHKAVILAYLMPAKTYISVLDSRKRFRLNDCIDEFTNVEMAHG
jgi:hypothetical protein